MSLLEKDKFSYSNKETLDYLLTMQRRIQAVYPGSSLKDEMSHMLMRLPVELHAIIKPSMREVTDISEFISICEEVTDSSWGRKTAFTRTVNFHKRDDEPVKDRRTFEKKKPLSVPLHGSSNDLKPKK